jgi:hypothetical protein
LSGDITVVADLFGTDEIEVDNNGTVTTCTQDDSDADNCELTGLALSIGSDTQIDVAPASTLTITFRVTID